MNQILDRDLGPSGKKTKKQNFENETGLLVDDDEVWELIENENSISKPTADLKSVENGLTELKSGLLDPRVKMTGPVRLYVEDSDQVCTGACVNVSLTGLGCLVPRRLDAAKKIWVNFSMGFGDYMLPAVVVWSGTRTGSKTSECGLRFTFLSAQDEKRLRRDVRRRSGGMHVTHWLSGTFGLAAGVVAGLLVALAVPRTGITANIQPNPVMAEVGQDTPIVPDEGNWATGQGGPQLECREGHYYSELCSSVTDEKKNSAFEKKKKRNLKRKLKKMKADSKQVGFKSQRRKR